MMYTSNIEGFQADIQQSGAPGIDCQLTARLPEIWICHPAPKFEQTAAHL